MASVAAGSEVPVKVKLMVERLYESALESKREMDFGIACDTYTALLNLMQEHYEPNDAFFARVQVDYAAALIENFVDNKLMKPNEEEKNISNHEENNEAEESGNSYGDDPILGNTEVIRTGEDDVNVTADSVNEEEMEEESDIELAWNILESTRIILENNIEDSLCAKYLVICRGLIATIYKENNQFENSLQESAAAKELYKSHNIEDPRLYADLCYNRAYCNFMNLDSKAASEDYKEAIKELETLLKSDDCVDKTDLSSIIASIQNQLDECLKTELSKDTVTKDIMEFMKSWSRNIESNKVDVTCDDENEMKDDLHGKRKAEDISHLVRKKPKSEDI